MISRISMVVFFLATGLNLLFNVETGIIIGVAAFVAAIALIAEK